MIELISADFMERLIHPFPLSVLAFVIALACALPRLHRMEIANSHEMAVRRARGRIAVMAGKAIASVIEESIRDGIINGLNDGFRIKK